MSGVLKNGIRESAQNSTSTILTAGQTFTGIAEDVLGFPGLCVASKSDQAGTLYVDFSPDGTNWDSTLTYSTAASTNEVHRLVVTRRYCRIRYTNGGVNQGYFRLQTTFGPFESLTSGLNSTIQSDADALITRSVLVGATDGGMYQNVPVTAEGHLEVALHAPRLPFGSVHTESLTPVFQTDGVYGISSEQIISTTGLSVGTGANTGSNTSSGNLLTCATGTTALSFATMQSRRRLRYRPGQGIITRYTALFSTPAASSILVAGVGTAESGYFFGYNGTSFGILHSTGGVREIQTLTITTASTATNDYVITLPNTATVNVTATNNSSTIKTAYEISKGTYPGWTANQVGSTVVFVASSASNVSGTFSLAQTGAVTPAAGSCVETLAGAASSDNWIAQSSWNGDKLDGTGASGVTLDPSKGNVFQIKLQYLGFGSVVFEVEVNPDDANNPDFVAVHTLKFPNTRTSVTQSQPSFPFTMAAYSAGSTTNVSVSVGSFAGFIEGKRVAIGPRQSYYNNTGVTSSTSAYVPIFTVRNNIVFNSRTNQVVSNLLGVSGAAKSNTGLTTFYLIKNATLTGTPNFTAWASSSATYVDTASTGCSFSTNDQVIWSGTISETGDFDHGFSEDQQITLQPGETVTLAVRSVTATAVCVGALNIREDQ